MKGWFRKIIKQFGLLPFNVVWEMFDISLNCKKKWIVLFTSVSYLFLDNFIGKVFSHDINFNNVLEGQIKFSICLQSKVIGLHCVQHSVYHLKQAA